MDLTEKRIEIVPFEDRYTKAFKQLNLERLKKYELLKPIDLEYLVKPRQTIIDRGGKILMAITNGMIVGSCAIIKKTAHTAEFAKLAVLPDVREKGIGSLLIIASINLAQKMGFKKIVLVSDKKLNKAVRFYESFGFMHGTVPEDIKYKTENVYMVFNIS